MFLNDDSKTIAGKSDVELAYEVLKKTGENVRNIKPRYTANRSEEYCPVGHLHIISGKH